MSFEYVGAGADDDDSSASEDEDEDDAMITKMQQEYNSSTSRKQPDSDDASDDGSTDSEGEDDLDDDKVDTVDDTVVQIKILSKNRVLKIDTVTLHLVDGADKVFNVHAEIGTEQHPELRVHSGASKEQKAEEWEEATVKKEGHSRKYWYSKVKGKSEWKEPLKYYPVKFKNRPTRSGGLN